MTRFFFRFNLSVQRPFNKHHTSRKVKGSTLNWHTLDPSETCDLLQSSKHGLTLQEAQARLAKEGFNELKASKKRPAIFIFFAQFTDFMIVILILAAVVSFFVGDLKDALAILAILVVNAVIGFTQEYRAEKALEALQAMTSSTAAVSRGGKAAVIPAREIVPGDCVTLEAGRIVPADLRLIETANLTIDESALTGESVTVKKTTQKLTAEDIPLGDRTNMAYKGTIVSSGRGVGITVMTGLKTEIGKIAELLESQTDKKTPLQTRLAGLGKKLTVAALLICAVIFASGILRGESVISIFMVAVSVAVAAIPEALPAVITISLALGAKKMVQKKILIRKLSAVETLGSVTYICTDKTGTLTQNLMKAGKFYANNVLTERLVNDTDSLKFIRSIALSNDVVQNEKGALLGDPSETALYEAAEEAGFKKKALELEFPRVSEIPFDSNRKCMTTLHQKKEGGYISFTKGAPEIIARFLASGEKEMLRVSEKMADDGYRVIAFAFREWPSLPEAAAQTVEKDLQFSGLVGLMDPPREEARESVSLCRLAGIRPVMITGDHPATARAIAKTLGIWTGSAVMTGQTLAAASEDEFRKQVEKIEVYARVSPEQKLKIVKALQDCGQYVAMTGDGVNDAPALKKADIGVAMGINGTDVAKQSSSMILLDDNFSSIVRAVREGRKIYDNLRRFVKYAVTTNTAEILIIFLGPIFGLPITFLPIQLLWINLLTDGLPGVALAAEKEEKDVMNRPPRPPSEGIFAHGMNWHVLLMGLLMAAITLIVQKTNLHREESHWRTMAFTVLCLSQLAHVVAIRSEKESLFRINIFSNKPLFFAVLLTFVLQLGTIYIPWMNSVFHTSPLGPKDILMAAAVSFIIILAVELEKWVRRMLLHKKTHF